MGYEFVRRLVKGAPEELAVRLAELLTENGIEVYVKAGDKYVSPEPAAFSGDEIFVPAADRERAAELAASAGASAFLCSDPVESMEMTETERLEAELFRRQRRNMAVCFAVVAAAAVYYVVRMFF